MGREQRRAKAREEDKRDRDAQLSARKVAATSFRSMTKDAPETLNETARRIYRTGGKAKPERKVRRRMNDKPVKWREGRQ
jgi:hypothetical protein